MDKTKKNNEKLFLPLVYICSPYSGNTKKNTIATRKYSRFALEKYTIPLAPHLLFPQFMNDKDENERKLAMFCNKILQGKCQEVWVFGSNITSGMKAEIELAKLRHQKIRYFDERCREVI